MLALTSTSGLLWAQAGIGSRPGASVVVTSIDHRGLPGRFHHRFPGTHEQPSTFFPPIVFMTADENESAAPIFENPMLVTSPPNAPPASATKQDQQYSPGAKLIELNGPGLQDSSSVVNLPGTIFMLADGRELQAERYTITGEYVYISQGRSQKRIRVDDLNIQATVDANRRNGIELRIPSTPSEFFLSY